MKRRQQRRRRCRTPAFTVVGAHTSGCCLWKHKGGPLAVYKRQSSRSRRAYRRVWMPTTQAVMVYECVYGVLKALQSGDCESASALLLGRNRSTNDDSTFVAPSSKRCVFRSIARQAGQPFWPSPIAAFSACPAFTQEYPTQTPIVNSPANISNVSPGLKKGLGLQGIEI